MQSSAARALRDSVVANLGRVRERVAAACLRSGRDPKSVSIVAVTNNGGPSLVSALLELGQLDLGESRSERIAAIDPVLPTSLPRPRWHMVGHLQRNKARKAAPLLAALHSLDSSELARKLDQRRGELSLPPLAVYIEVNLGEDQKAGVAPGEVAALAKEIGELPHLSWAGLMGMPPANDNPEVSRAHFKSLRELAATIEPARSLGLSMGMTQDLEVAIEEGATIVRVGHALVEGVPGDVLEHDASLSNTRAAGG